MTALDELRTLDERRRAEARAQEQAEAEARARTEAAVRERLAAEEERRRQQRSQAEAQAWADATREVEAARARHAAEDQDRIAAIEADALARARARLAAERAELDRALATDRAGPRPHRGWTVVAVALAAAVVAVALWGRRQTAALDDEIGSRVAAERAAEQAGLRAERLAADLRATLGQVGELRRRVDELRDRRSPPTPAAPTAPGPAPSTTTRPIGPRPPVVPPGANSGPHQGPLTVCTDSPLC